MAVRWRGWLEKRGRSAFSKIDHRFFVLREGSGRAYSFEYYAAPTSLKVLIGQDAGDEPSRRGLERRGCLNVADISDVTAVGGVVNIRTPEKTFELFAPR